MKQTLILLLTSLMTVMGSCRNENVLPSGTNSSLTLIPWLAANGQFGFADGSGRMVIQPQYEDAGLFHHGFAAVKKEGKYGVINSQNKVVFPFKYTVAKLISKENFTLLVTKKKYNAWWHVWHWRWWPEWNILGGNSGPALVTKVPRAKWQVWTLPGKKKLFSDRRPDEKTAMGTHQYWKKDWKPSQEIPSDLDILYTFGFLSIDGKTYQLNGKGRLIRFRSDPEVFVNDSTMLLKNGLSYELTDLKGKPVSHSKFSRQQGISGVTISGDTFFISQKGDLGVAWPVIHAPIFKSDKGQYFIAPYFSMAFPGRVGNYHYQDIFLTGKDILQGAVTIAPRTGDYFMVFSGAGKGPGWKAYFLNKDGHWNDSVPPFRGPGNVYNGGRIAFDRAVKKGILDTGFVFYSMPLSNIRPCQQHHFWYMGEDTATEKYGVYDAQKQRWQIAPQFSFLQREIAPNVAVYNVIRKNTTGAEREYSGLINIETGKKITPAKYNSIENNGRVSVIINGKERHFYINPYTGEEYVTKKDRHE